MSETSDVKESVCVSVSVSDIVRSSVCVAVRDFSRVPVSDWDSDSVNVCVCDKVISGERVAVNVCSDVIESD